MYVCVFVYVWYVHISTCTGRDFPLGFWSCPQCCTYAFKYVCLYVSMHVSMHVCGQSFTPCFQRIEIHKLNDSNYVSILISLPAASHVHNRLEHRNVILQLCVNIDSLTSCEPCFQRVETPSVLRARSVRGNGVHVLFGGVPFVLSEVVDRVE